MDKRIRSILEYAILAPSGDNCQPWKIAVGESCLKLYNDPDRDQSLYNLKQRASLISHGAFLENVKLASLSEGLDSQFDLLPEPNNINHIANINFSETEKKRTQLFEVIKHRHTNREKYKPIKITENQAKGWCDLTTDFSGLSIWVTCQDGQIADLAKHLSFNDKLVFDVPLLHQFLFEQLRWSSHEAELSGDGLDIVTLGLNPVDRYFFKFFKSRTLVNFLNTLGLSTLIRIKAEQLIKSASAIAIISSNNTNTLDYIKAGIVWQRLLLKCASEGLSAQPIAGLACLMQSAREGVLTDYVEDKFVRELLTRRNRILDYIGRNSSESIVGMFRIGLGPKVTHSLRRPIETFLL